MDKTIYHLSHTDLDGYSCQLIMKHTPYTKKNFNANYGAEVKETLSLMLELIAKDSSATTLLVSDLNLTLDESKWLDAEVAKLKNIDLILLDHHISGLECSKKFKWYYLDSSRCATKIVYDYAKEHFSLDEPSWMSSFVDVVNAVDLWLMQEYENFELGKVFMKLVSDARELNKIMFDTQDNSYKLSLIEKAIDFIGKKDANIALDNALHSIKKEFFRLDKDDTLDNLSTKFIVNLLGTQRADKTIYYKGYKGFLSYALGNTSIIGNGFLLSYPEYDFIVDVSFKGTMSLRANNMVSVAQISKEWVGGGGHANAAGGRIIGFKEQFRYDKVKEQIEAIINEKESVAGELEFKSDLK